MGQTIHEHIKTCIKPFISVKKDNTAVCETCGMTWKLEKGKYITYGIISEVKHEPVKPDEEFLYFEQFRGDVE